MGLRRGRSPEDASGDRRPSLRFSHVLEGSQGMGAPRETSRPPPLSDESVGLRKTHRCTNGRAPMRPHSRHAPHSDRDRHGPRPRAGHGEPGRRARPARWWRPRTAWKPRCCAQRQLIRQHRDTGQATAPRWTWRLDEFQDFFWSFSPQRRPAQSPFSVPDTKKAQINQGDIEVWSCTPGIYLVNTKKPTHTRRLQRPARARTGLPTTRARTREGRQRVPSSEAIHSRNKDHEPLLGIAVVVVVIIVTVGLATPIGAIGVCTIISTVCMTVATVMGVRARQTR